MLPSNCNNKKDINYEIAQINSFDEMHANIQCGRMTIGNTSNQVEHRVLIKFNLDHLPDNIQLTNATLTVYVTKGSNFQLLGYNLKSGWDIHSVNWINQPAIDCSHRIIDEMISGCDLYYIDLTDQVRRWLESPDDNYGMVLMGLDMRCSNNIQICTEISSSDNLSLFVKYCTGKDVHCVPRFFEHREDLMVSGGLEYFTTGINISLMKTVAYFIKNNNSAQITVTAENSPDNLNFAKEIQTIYIPPGKSSLLVPINFSKYVRLSITIPPDGNLSTIYVWLNMQQ